MSQPGVDALGRLPGTGFCHLHCLSWCPLPHPRSELMQALVLAPPRGSRHWQATRISRLEPRGLGTRASEPPPRRIEVDGEHAVAGRSALEEVIPAVGLSPRLRLVSMEVIPARCPVIHRGRERGFLVPGAGLEL